MAKYVKIKFVCDSKWCNDPQGSVAPAQAEYECVIENDGRQLVLKGKPEGWTDRFITLCPKCSKRVEENTR